MAAQIRVHTAKRSSPQRKETHGLGLAILFVLPAAVLVLTLMYYPMIRTFYESLFSTSFLNPTPEYIGLQRYSDMLHDSDFWQIVQNSLVWTISVVLFQNVFGVLTALLLNQNLPGKSLMRGIVLLPWVLPGIVAALLWRFMYDPQLGLINSILISLGVTTQKTAWLAEPGMAMVAVIVAAVWKGFPFSTVIYLAALQGVDQQQIEAAQIDGANAVQRFFRVVIPSISGIIRLNLLLTTVFTFNYFDMIWVTTRGGPLDSTHIFPTIIYEYGFGKFKFGDAAAYGVVAVLILSVFALLYLYELRESIRGRAS
ncbi:MAG TPA: sugar ABC transporter permease [Aggregatilinea sp.]|uniref:carbohydrate ABC transporter permease n=1 Tax=Aggregatilinea sp. TaxID=2806333 RepID=UPI002BF816E5|nr:sugar ABC transporter permease [Aggregatilinea sp.]HML21390.1 sugar ABC transporter permease [Aggregatilinea sp.]